MASFRWPSRRMRSWTAFGCELDGPDPSGAQSGDAPSNRRSPSRGKSPTWRQDVAAVAVNAGKVELIGMVAAALKAAQPASPRAKPPQSRPSSVDATLTTSRDGRRWPLLDKPVALRAGLNASARKRKTGQAPPQPRTAVPDDRGLGRIAPPGLAMNGTAEIRGDI